MTTVLSPSTTGELQQPLPSAIKLTVSYLRRAGGPKSRREKCWRDGTLTLSRYHGSLVDEDTETVISSSRGAAPLQPCVWYTKLVEEGEANGVLLREGQSFRLPQCVYEVEVSRVWPQPKPQATVTAAVTEKAATSVPPGEAVPSTALATPAALLPSSSSMRKRHRVHSDHSPSHSEQPAAMSTNTISKSTRSQYARSLLLHLQALPASSAVE